MGTYDIQKTTQQNHHETPQHVCQPYDPRPEQKALQAERLHFVCDFKATPRKEHSLFLQSKLKTARGENDSVAEAWEVSMAEGGRR